MPVPFGAEPERADARGTFRLAICPRLPAERCFGIDFVPTCKTLFQLMKQAGRFSTPKPAPSLACLASNRGEHCRGWAAQLGVSWMYVLRNFPEACKDRTGLHETERKLENAEQRPPSRQNSTFQVGSSGIARSDTSGRLTSSSDMVAGKPGHVVCERVTLRPDVRHPVPPGQVPNAGCGSALRLCGHGFS